MEFIKIILGLLLWYQVRAADNVLPNQFQFTDPLRLPNRSPTKDQTYNNNGAVASMIENLAYNTAQITDEMQVQLNTRVERTSNALLGSIQVLVANAMDRLSDAIFEANRMLTNDACAQDWTMEELMDRVNAQLMNCTNDIQSIMQEFKSESDLISQTLQSYVRDIIDLPNLCEVLTSNANATFVSATTCFVEKMADYNKELSQIFRNANSAVMETRRVSRSNEVSAQDCTDNVISETIEFLKRSFEKCRRA